MKFPFKAAMLCVSLLLVLSGCASPEAARVEEKPAAPAVAQPKAKEQKPSPTVVDIQTRRQLEKELERDVSSYFKLITERNVDGAVRHVHPDAKTSVQNDLWQLLADYNVENFEVISKAVDFEGKSPKAAVRTVLIVYQKNVVSPQRKEIGTNWVRQDDQWLIRP